MLTLLFILFCGVAQAHSVEADILKSLNQLRSEPQSFLPDLRALEKRFKGKTIPLEPHVIVETNEGKPAVQEAIKFVDAAKPAPKLATSEALTLAARDHVADQSRSGKTGHVSGDGATTDRRIAKHGVWRGGIGENITYGYYAGKDGRAIVIALLVDDGVPSRGHRENLFDPKFTRVGIACGSHPKFPHMCVIDFAHRMEVAK